MVSTRLLRPAAVFLLLAPAPGCDSPPGRPTVSGQVMLNGRPLADKTLTLVLDGPDPFSQSFQVNAQGKFSGSIPQPGTYKVVIKESMAVMEGVQKKKDDAQEVPEKYQAPASTDERVTIKPGSNELTIALKD